MLRRFGRLFTTPRMGRPEFIGWSILFILFWIPTYLIGESSTAMLPLDLPLALVLLFYWLALLLFSVLSVVFTIRRLHDTNRSGFWYLLNLVPILGHIFLFIWTVLTPGTPGPNRFGPGPIWGDDALVAVFGDSDDGPRASGRASGSAPTQDKAASAERQRPVVRSIDLYRFPCPQCGRMNGLEAAKCPSCGTRI